MERDVEELNDDVEAWEYLEFDNDKVKNARYPPSLQKQLEVLDIEYSTDLQNWFSENLQTILEITEKGEPSFLFEELAKLYIVSSMDIDLPSRLIQLSNLIVQYLVPSEISCTRIAKSTILNAGNGLFATRNIAVGQHITVYGGIYYESATAFEKERGYKHTDNEPPIKTNYIVELFPDVDGEVPYLDGRLGFYLWQQGRWANTQIESDACNADFAEVTATDDSYWQLRLIATKPIANGDEIFVDYGQGYIEDRLTKRNKTEDDCIQCQVQDATHEFLGYPHLMFCGQSCAVRWYKNKVKRHSFYL